MALHRHCLFDDVICEGDLLRRGQDLAAATGGPNGLSQIDVYERQPSFTRIRTSQRHQVVDQRAGANGLLINVLQGFGMDLRRFARVPQAELIAVDRAKHLWVGEPYVRIVLNEIVRRVNPPAAPLPTEWKD